MEITSVCTNRHFPSLALAELSLKLKHFVQLNQLKHCNSSSSCTDLVFELLLESLDLVTQTFLFLLVGFLQQL